MCRDLDNDNFSSHDGIGQSILLREKIYMYIAALPYCKRSAECLLCIAKASIEQK